jgi:arylsulfatase A-like enzyme/Flp pilus assembly protein TadD
MHGRVAIVLSTALAACVVCACGRAVPAGGSSLARPNVLLVTIDTLRADRIGIGMAPTLDRLAADSLQFTQARTAVPLTLPSHTTVFTGLWPPAHGVRENGVDRLSDRHPTVARLLHDAGYRTAAFVGAYVLDHRFGLSQGFDTYDDHIPRDPNASERLEAERPASAVIDGALAWLESSSGPAVSGTSAPFFLWIHLYDPHAPYDAPAAFLERVRVVEAARPEPDTGDALRYDAEVAYADAQIDRVLQRLRAKALFDRTLIIVAGDHGEGLDEHGERTHGMLLYDATLRVPLIVSAPGRPAMRRTDFVSLVDLAPTMLHATGIAVPQAMTGRDLLAAVRPPRAVDVYAETDYPRVAGWSPLQALTDGRWKAIRAGRAAEVYDLQNDPAEQHDLAAAQRPIAAAMGARIDDIRAAGGARPPGGTVSDETAERLGALGYVTGGTSQSTAGDAPNPATQMAAWSAFEEALNAVNVRQPAARTALKQLAGAHPSAPVFQMTYARALKDAGELTPALAVDRAAAKRWPTDSALLHDLAVTAREAAHRAEGPAAASLLGEASRAEQAALVLAPENPSSHNSLGLIAVDAGRPADAAREFERAVSLDAANASYWVNLGNARRSLHDATRAEHAYRRALDADGHAADAANGIGVLLVEANRAADAVPWLERAVAASPDFVDARLNLGIALQQSGQSARAADMYRQVLAAPARYQREREAAAKLLASLRAGR